MNSKHVRTFPVLDGYWDDWQGSQDSHHSRVFYTRERSRES